MAKALLKSSDFRILHVYYSDKVSQSCFNTTELGFPTGRDSVTFRDKGTEVPSLSRDKGSTGQAQNLAKGRDGPGQPVKIRDMTRDRTV